MANSVSPKLIPDGTYQSSFQVDQGNSGPKWKNESGVMALRNAGDSAYANAKVKELNINGIQTYCGTASSENGSWVVITPAISGRMQLVVKQDPNVDNSYIGMSFYDKNNNRVFSNFVAFNSSMYFDLDNANGYYHFRNNQQDVNSILTLCQNRSAMVGYDIGSGQGPNYGLGVKGDTWLDSDVYMRTSGKKFYLGSTSSYPYFSALSTTAIGMKEGTYFHLGPTSGYPALYPGTQSYSVGVARLGVSQIENANTITLMDAVARAEYSKNEGQIGVKCHDLGDGNKALRYRAWGGAAANIRLGSFVAIMTGGNDNAGETFPLIATLDAWIKFPTNPTTYKIFKYSNKVGTGTFSNGTAIRHKTGETRNWEGAVEISSAVTSTMGYITMHWLSGAGDITVNDEFEISEATGTYATLTEVRSTTGIGWMTYKMGDITSYYQKSILRLDQVYMSWNFADDASNYSNFRIKVLKNNGSAELDHWFIMEFLTIDYSSQGCYFWGVDPKEQITHSRVYCMGTGYFKDGITVYDYLDSNYGLRISGKTIRPPSGTQSIVAATGITSAMMLYTKIRIQGSGGAVDITANPQIAAGIEGQEIIFEGRSNTDTVKFDDGTGLSLDGGASCTLGKGDKISLEYNATDSLWYENWRTNNNG